MNREKQSAKQFVGANGFFFYLSLILAVVTIIGFFSALSSSSALTKAWNRTEKELKNKEEGLLFLLSCLQDGSLLLSCGEDALSYDAILPEKSSLSLSGDGYDLSLFASGEKITANSESLLPESLSGDRSFAATALTDSAFSSEEVKGEHLDLIRLFLAFSDHNMPESDLLSQWGRTLWKKMKPTLSREDKTLSYGEGIPAETYCYTVSSEGLVSALESWKKIGQDERNSNALCAAVCALRAGFGMETRSEDLEEMRAFAKGEGDFFNELLRLAQKEDSVLTAEFSVFDGCVILVEWKFQFGDFSGNLSLFFGADVENAPEQIVSFSLYQGEETALELSLASRVSENSKKAYIRELAYSVTDGVGVLLGDLKTTTGKIRFSWGKTKGDLGLRFIGEEKEISFRGSVIQWKKGKEVQFEIQGIEVNRENRLNGKTVFVTYRAKGNPASSPDAKGELFPFGEKKETLKEAFLRSYTTVFSGGLS